MKFPNAWGDPPLSVHMQISKYMYHAYIAPLLSLVSAAVQFVSQCPLVVQVSVVVPPLSPPLGPEGCERTALPSEAHL